MEGKRILIVEDEGIVAEEIRIRLKNQGYAVPGIASSGREAIKAVTEMRPDLVLMDIKLKGDMDGIDTTTEIRASFDIPVIYLTAYADENTLQRAKITEPFGYILKPFEERELHTAIEMALYKHKMEKKLRESEEQYRTLFNNALLGIYRITPDDHVLLANPAFVEMMGYENFEELGGRSLEGECTLFCPEHPRNKIREQVDKFGEIKNLECAWQKKDGGTLYTNEYIKAAYHVGGKVLYYEGIVEDISEKKQAEKEKQEALQLLESTFSKIRDAAFIIDASSAEVTYCNTAASELFGTIEVSQSSIDESLVIVSSRKQGSEDEDDVEKKEGEEE